MDPALGASGLLKRLDSFRVEEDDSDPVRFVDLATQAPNFDGPQGSLISVGVAQFARLAYCPYTIWHNIRRTQEVRPAKAEIAVAKGKAVHLERESAALKVVAKAKAASKKQLRDPRVDLVELPEFPGCFRRENWLYRAKLDGLSREGGDLVVHELKTGHYPRMPDHLLQVWGYCLASPGAMTKLTDGNLRANGVSWVVEYPVLGEMWGPFQFRTAQLELLIKAMTFYEATGLASLTDDDMNLGWRSFPAKCAPCSYFHACQWKVEPRPRAEPSTGTLISLDTFLDPSPAEKRGHGSRSSRRHRNNRVRTVR